MSALGAKADISRAVAAVPGPTNSGRLAVLGYR